VSHVNYTHITAPTRFVEGVGIRFAGHGVLFQFPGLFVAHGRMFLEGS